MTNKITYDELRQHIHYDPLTGHMRWIRSTSNVAPVGSMVRGKTTKGYLRVQIFKVRYKAHDIAYFYMHGEWPIHIIDHADCNPSNLIWMNLRAATQMQNCANRSMAKNNTSGVKGVSWHKREQKWVVRVGVGKKRLQLGSYDDLGYACHIAVSARALLHGAFARNE